MFESINYRGKKLTKFEVLKNRLIYLVELLGQANPDQQPRASALRDQIDTVWGEAFDWFGHNSTPLSEDDFLLQHTIMYFGSLPREKEALDQLLFKEYFSNDRLGQADDDPVTLNEIETYIDSVRRSSELWSFQNACLHTVSIPSFPGSNEVVDWVLRLNRLGMRHFRPLILAALSQMTRAGTMETAETLVDLLKVIERFIFIVYGLCDNYANHPSRTYFGNYGNFIYYDERGYSFSEIVKHVDAYLDQYDEDGEFIGEFSPTRFIDKVHARFIGDKGWRSWNDIKYFLSEWEATCSQEEADVIPQRAYEYASIEHIMPQNASAPGLWDSNQKSLGKRFKYVVDDLGNLTLLGVGANKAVQDIDLISKASAYEMTGGGRDILRRAGQRGKWGEEQILQRGRDMVRFICERWNLPGHDDSNSELYFDYDEALSTNVKAPRQKRAG